MLSRLRALIGKELIQIARDRPMVFLSLYIFAEIVNCGYALTMEVRHIPTAVLDRDSSFASRALVDRFRATVAFRVEFYPRNEEELDRLLDSGQVALGLIIPPDFSRNLASGKTAAIEGVADGTETNNALIGLSYVTRVVRRQSFEIEVARLNRAGLAALIDAVPSVDAKVRAWYLPALTYVHFLMVSMIVLAVVIVGVLLASAGVVREKETGTFEQLLVTPVRPAELVVAKLIPLIILEIVGLALGLALAFVLFGVPPHGNAARALVLIFASSVLAVVASASIGLAIATVAANLQQALLLAFFILFPILFLSGTLVPVTAMPDWLRWLAYAGPVWHYLTVALDVYIKGVGPSVVWLHIALLTAITMILMGFAVLRLRRVLA